MNESGHSDTTTDGIRVRVAAQYIEAQSDPERNHWVYAYRVVISNEGDVPAKLISRHWIIRDANNDVEEVRGAGVVGENPDLAPGEQFEYMSGCPLATEWGTMEGRYTMQRPGGEEFDAVVGRFFLAPNTAPIAAMDED
ncbi:Co2+/Mg2+ efflux protein ApaG [Engelhardtia mirabilis]|uniref:Protein ApaG n=1 Tax=Engelhardtia mirabilis TaxID=2528011 RepID=A0A518BLE7_9BACT|nr:CO2+/MG2+ efflux protein ApaG [Planctomycetes bacterium Pla133]QDV02111.1 CO2+/MG2+ efflux protein ApaG [Planctomycetes bacterium Pla86]